MLVEDDNSLREIYQARLAAEGYDTVSAKDGEEALALVGKEKPDLIILDVMMPKISGFDTLDILRSTPATKETKVIIMSALSQAEDKTRAEKLGADRYLVKSQVTLEDIVKTVKEVLDGDNPTAGTAPIPQAADTPAATSTNPPAPVANSLPPQPVSLPTETPSPNDSVTNDTTKPIDAAEPTPTTSPDIPESETTAQEEDVVSKQVHEFADSKSPTTTTSTDSATIPISLQDDGTNKVDLTKSDSTPPAQTDTKPADDTNSLKLDTANTTPQATPIPVTDDPVVPEPAAPTTQTPAAPKPEPVELAGGTKVIQPLVSDSSTKKPSLDDLLAKEEASTPAPAEDPGPDKPDNKAL